MSANVMDADIVLEGGGVRGIALVGAVEVLEEHGYRFRRVAGTSAGSIVGALVAAGIPAAKQVEIMRQVQYSRFQDGAFYERLFIGKAVELALRHGIYRGDYAHDWIAGLLRDAGVGTFADLAYQDPDPARALPPDKQFKLVVMASDLSQGCLRRLPYDYRDQYGLPPAEQTVADAVRASMSIPFFFRPTIWTTRAGVKSWLVDGGILSNFPIDVFDAPEGKSVRWPTFGIKLSAQPDAPQGVINRITGTVSMGTAMVSTWQGFYDRMHIDDDQVTDRTIFIDTGKVKSTNFHLSPGEQQMLYQNGRRAAEKFLLTWDFEAYLAKHHLPSGLSGAGV